MRYYKLSEGLILTYNESGLEVIRNNDGEYKIIIIPVWSWLLQNDMR
jgi:predicted AAA+ superfamily ATPase